MIGGAAGAVPVLVGWAAVRNSLGMAPLVLFAIIFVWTPPHFWALAIKYRDDYTAADVPMLPRCRLLRPTARRSPHLHRRPLGHLPWSSPSVGGMGLIYLVTALVLGAVFLYLALELRRDGTYDRAMRLFTYSITLRDAAVLGHGGRPTRAPALTAWR